MDRFKYYFGKNEKDYKFFMAAIKEMAKLLNKYGKCIPIISDKNILIPFHKLHKDVEKLLEDYDIDGTDLNYYFEDVLKCDLDFFGFEFTYERSDIASFWQSSLF